MIVDEAHPPSRASRARHEGLGVAWGLVNGIIFTVGLWLAIIGLVLLLLGNRTGSPAHDGATAPTARDGGHGSASQKASAPQRR